MTEPDRQEPDPRAEALKRATVSLMEIRKGLHVGEAQETMEACLSKLPESLNMQNIKERILFNKSTPMVK